MPTIDAVVPRNVRAERARLAWRQSDLAEASGLSVNQISDLERGARRVGLRDVRDLCRALNVPLTELLRGADEADLRVLGLRP